MTRMARRRLRAAVLRPHRRLEISGMRIIKRVVFALLILLVVLFALLNSDNVRLNLLITPLGFELPLSLIVFVVFFLGFFLGWSGAVLRQGFLHLRSRPLSSRKDSEQEAK